MKRIKSECSDNCLKEALFLRYGIRSPTKDSTPLLPLDKVANVLEVKVGILSERIRRYFKAKFGPTNKDGEIYESKIRRSKRR